jgi:hypothetical protein
VADDVAPERPVVVGGVVLERQVEQSGELPGLGSPHVQEGVDQAAPDRRHPGEAGGSGAPEQVAEDGLGLVVGGVAHRHPLVHAGDLAQCPVAGVPGHGFGRGPGSDPDPHHGELDAEALGHLDRRFLEIGRSGEAVIDVDSAGVAASGGGPEEDGAVGAAAEGNGGGTGRHPGGEPPVHRPREAS